MKIVITGALGHIGSRLIRDLPGLIPVSELVLVDNVLTQRYPSLFCLAQRPCHRFIEADVTQVDLEPILTGGACVIHLAAITDATRSFEQKDEVEHVNFTATSRVAEACANAGIPMLFPSSTSVYGTQVGVVDENCPNEDLTPQSPYAETKLREENHLAGIADAADLRFVVCRFGTIFGISPGMRFHTAVNKFCWQAAMGQPLTVWRTAFDQKRPYLDLADAVRAIAHIVANDRYDGRVYNVVTVNAAVRDVVEIVCRYVPGAKISFVDQQIMNQLSYEVDNTRFAETGFQFEGNLERGIEETLSLLKGV